MGNILMEKAGLALAEVGYSLFNRGLSHGSTGNMSLKLEDGSILMTPTGSSLGRLEPCELSHFDPAGRHVAGNPPTKESFLHMACYAARSEARAVIHLHSPYATAVSCMAGLPSENVLLPLTPYVARKIGRLPLASYQTPGSPLLAEQIAELLPGGVAVLLANHGPVVTGTSLEDALDNYEELEAACRIQIILHGHEVNFLTSEQLAEFTH